MTEINKSSAPVILQPTPAREWRKQNVEGISVTLPSGNIARIRNVQLAGLMVRVKNLPDSLSSIVAGAILNGVNSMADKRKIGDLLQGTIELQNAVCELAFIEPRVVASPEKDDEIGVDDVAPGDKQFLLGLLMQSAQELAGFRQEAV